MKISERHLVTCAILLQLIKAKINLETSQELVAEVRVVLEEVTVVAGVVAGVVARAVDAGKEATNINNKKELSAQTCTIEEWGQLRYEQKESVRKLRLAYKRQASAVSLIMTHNNNETSN